MANNPTGEMPFLDHLEELRCRIIWSLAALAVGLGIGFYVVVKLNLLSLLQKPIAPFLAGHKLVYTHPGDPFSLTLNAALVVGAIIASPVIADGKLQSGPRLIQLPQGETVALKVTSDRNDELHVHGYDLHAQLLERVEGEGRIAEQHHRVVLHADEHVPLCLRGGHAENGSEEEDRCEDPDASTQ